MREICTSGSVGGEGGNILAYLASTARHCSSRRLRVIKRWFRTADQMQHKGFRTAQVKVISLQVGGRFQQRSLDFGAVHMKRRGS